METTSNPSIFTNTATKTRDGRTRTSPQDEERISDIYDMKRGNELKL